MVASVHSKLRMDVARHDRAHAGRHREPPHRHPRPLHRSAHHRPGPGPIDLRCRRGVRRLRPHGHGGGDQLAARAPGPARRTCSARPSPSGAPSPSTPTRTRRASSAGSAGAVAKAVDAEVPPESDRQPRVRSTTSSPGRAPMGPDCAMTLPSVRPSRPCWPSSPATCPGTTGSSTSRSGTASAASSSATATTSNWAAATRSRSPATSPSWSRRCGASCPSRCVLDGEIVIAGPTGLDFDALSQRIHPAEKRIRLLAESTPASFVAFDLLAHDDTLLHGDALREAARGAREAAGQGPSARPPHSGHRRPRRGRRTGSPASRAPGSTAWWSRPATCTTCPTSGPWSR